MTRQELIDATKLRYKQNTDELDDVIGEWIDEGYRRITRQFGWKQLIKASQQALTAGTNEYLLPADFFRMVDNSVVYWQDANQVGDNWGATSILMPISSDQIGVYQAMYQFTFPTVFAITSSTTAPGRKNLWVGPNFSQTGSLLQYQYYWQPEAYDESAADVPELGDYLTYYALARIAEYESDNEGSDRFSRLSREHMIAAFQLIAKG